MAYVTCIDSIRYKYRRVMIQVAFFIDFADMRELFLFQLHQNLSHHHDVCRF